MNHQAAVQPPSNQAAVPPTNNQTPDSFVLPSQFNVRLTMLSDWHVGTGAGRPGNIDRLLAREAEDFPFVPAKTLNGIWRDALERLTLGLDEGQGLCWSAWVDSLFGDQPSLAQAMTNGNPPHKPRPSMLSLSPARLPEALRQKIKAVSGKQDKRLYSALTFIKPGVQIDKASGTSQTDFLRFEEMGRVGSVLIAKCELNVPDSDDATRATASALLIASAKLVERLGGKRRRGSGLCKLEFLDENIAPVDENEKLNAVIYWLREKQNDVPKITRPNENNGKLVAEMSLPLSDKDQTNITGTGEEEQADVASVNEATVAAVSLAAATGSAAKADSEADNGWQWLEFSLKLLTPISIVVATLGNVSESLDFIPGTYLLPHITKILEKELGDKYRRAVVYGDIQVLPATIEINGARGVPVPKALAAHKLGGGFEQAGTVYNRLLEKVQEDAEGNTPQIKNYRAGYIGDYCFSLNGTNKLPAHRDVPRTVLTHNTVEDRVQRPTENVGGVYSREAIAAETILRGAIKLRQSIADELSRQDPRWIEKLKEQKQVRLGASRKDDYGAARLDIKGEPKALTSQAALNDDGRLTVCLLSDVLLRGASLRQTNLAEDLAGELEEKLFRKDNLDEVSLETFEPEQHELSSLLQVRRIESWQGSWGLPRPTLTALAAGSCVVFEIKKFDSLSAEQREVLQHRLRALEAAGIGERRGEGYGQLCFNPPLLVNEINGWEAADKVKDEISDDNLGADIADSDKAFARLIEQAAWRAELKVAVLKAADDHEKRKAMFGFDHKKNEPPMSQIGGLRRVISRLWQKLDDEGQSKDNREIVQGWLDHLRDTPNRNVKWAEKALNNIEKLIRCDSAVWDQLQNHWRTLPQLLREPSEMQKELWAEAVRSLFDACVRAHKRETERKI